MLVVMYAPMMAPVPVITGYVCIAVVPTWHRKTNVDAVCFGSNEKELSEGSGAW